MTVAKPSSHWSHHRGGRHTPAQESELIADLQTALLRLAKDKTEQLYLAAIPSALPELRSGIRINTKTAS